PSFVANRYFDNRSPADDFTGPGYGTSSYDHKRWLGLYRNSGVGPMVQFPKGEGYILTGNLSAARTLIDASRALHGLPSIGAITSATQLIQGGVNGCVPQTPTGTANA